MGSTTWNTNLNCNFIYNTLEKGDNVFFISNERMQIWVLPVQCVVNHYTKFFCVQIKKWEKNHTLTTISREAYVQAPSDNKNSEFKYRDRKMNEDELWMKSSHT